jgi:hypothetical protein
MTDQKSGWIYIKSDALKQMIAFNVEAGWVFCEDKTRYAPCELDIIEQSGASASLAVHRVKKYFKAKLSKSKRPISLAKIKTLSRDRNGI